MIDRRWGSRQKESWIAFQIALSNLSTLADPIQNVPNGLTTDASAYGVEGILLQRGNINSWRLVAFKSRQLKQVELAYPVHEKECLPVAHALQKWRQYLQEERFEVVIDHPSLWWLMSFREPCDRSAR